MLRQHEGQLPESTVAPLKSRPALLEKMGWGMIGAAILLWGVTSLVLLYGGVPANVGWCLLVVFVALVGVGLILVAAGAPIERSLLRRRSLPGEPAPLPVDPSWVEQWEELMRRPVQ